MYTPADENSSSFCSGLSFPFDSNKRQRLGTANDQKREDLAFLDSYSKVFGQHMPHVEATHLYLGCKKVTWTLIQPQREGSEEGGPQREGSEEGGPQREGSEEGEIQGEAPPGEVE